MFEHTSHFLHQISLPHFNILMLLGLALFGGTIGGRAFQKIYIPQVVGYICIGIALGQSGLKLIDAEMVRLLQPFSYFALGLIGFMIGGELKKEVFRRYGRQFVIILLAEGMMAFVIVAVLVGALGTLFFHDGRFFWSLGLLLGAISSATAPAATTDVLWEYKTRGPLTTTVLGIVAMDDALALLLFAVMASVVSRLTGQAAENLLMSIWLLVYEIGLAVLIGVVSGLGLVRLLKKYSEKERRLAFSLGTVLFVLGLSLTIKVDMLLASMTLGFIVVNWVPRMSKEVFKLVSGFASPIYVLFFVLVGAKLNLSQMSWTVIAITVVYLLGRTGGKMLGSFLGGKISRAPETVTRYLPFCLFSQAGVAIGLSIVAYNTFPGVIGNTIVIVITATTFVVQLIGPVSVKYAVTKAGEVGLNVTEEDIIHKTAIRDAMDQNPPVLQENTPLDKVLEIFSGTNNLYYPVVDQEKKLSGIISVDNIRNTLTELDLRGFILAADLLEPVKRTVSSGEMLIVARDMFNTYHLDFLPVVSEDNVLNGFMEKRHFDKWITTRLVEMQQKADILEGAEL